MDPIAGTTAAPAATDFIRAIVADDQRSGKHARRVHPLSARAQRVLAHRPCQIDLPELRSRRRFRRRLQPSIRRYQSHEGGRRVRRLHPGGCSLARLRLGRADVLRVRLFRVAVPVCRAAHTGREGLRRQPDGRRDSRTPRNADRRGPEQSLSGTRQSQRASTCFAGCGLESFPTVCTCCARRST